MALHAPIPVLRIFDEAMARDFYVGWLGFRVDWEHRFGPTFPLYMQVARDGAVFHLTGHWGDCTPGSKVMIPLDDVDALLAELKSRPITNFYPSVTEEPWGRTMTLTDPFGNHLVFHQCPRNEIS